MITINYDPITGLASLAQTTTIKAGGAVPVTVNFTTTPGTVNEIRLALGTDTPPPWILAYTNAFTAENATTYTATLNANDARLMRFMAGKAPTALNLELACSIGVVPVTSVSANLSITVQLPLITGDPTSEGGPTYYTEDQVNALITPLTPAPNQSDITLSTATTAALFTASQFSSLAVRILPGAGSATYQGNYSLPITGMATGAIAEVNVELPNSSHPTIGLYNATSAGTLLASVTNPAPAAAAYWYGRFRYDGSQWSCLFRGWNS